MVILHRNPISSALFLVLAFCALAGIYLTLGAEFIGMVQIIVYAGAIMVLFLFVIMYLNLRSDVDRGIQFPVRRGLGWLVGAGLLAAGVTLLMSAGRSGRSRSSRRRRRSATPRRWGGCCTRATCSRSRSPRSCCSSRWSAPS